MDNVGIVPDEHEEEQYDYYIASFVRYGRRSLTDEERRKLEPLREKYPGRARIALVITLISAAAMPASFYALYRQWFVIATLLMVPSLFAGCFGVFFYRSYKVRGDAVARELAFGQIDAYGMPPEWNTMNGDYPWIEIIRHSPASKRILWVRDRFFETEYASPTRVAKAPPTYHNLVDSGWLGEESELHRDLSNEEVEELRRHIASRRTQALLGIVGIIGLGVVATLLAISKRYVGGMTYLGVLAISLIPVGWRAWRQMQSLRLDLLHRRVVLVKESRPDGQAIVFEFLEQSGVQWTVSGSAAPWRGLPGAR